MDAEALIDALDRFRDVLPALAGQVPASDRRWRPPGGGWTVLEILGHMANEEELDFRARIESTLADPRRPWVPIDPEGWVVERRYDEADWDATLARWSSERTRSVDWLRGLKGVDWSRRHDHPRLGPLRAGDLLVSWACHDALHARQIARRAYERCLRDGEGFEARYAGPWT